ncbi:hypothetical protein ACHAWF_011056 [Thalassiosira exigua]
MEASHAWHEAALRGALDAMAEDDDDGGTTGSEAIVAGSAHALGAISARCGEYDEARRWYDEALARKRRIVEAAEAAADDEGGASSSSSARHELGKTLNAAAALEEAMDAYRSALEVATSALACSYDRAARETGVDESLDNGPSLDEQRNTIVDLLVKIADTLLVLARFDDAAAAYEQALIRHISFR